MSDSFDTFEGFDPADIIKLEQTFSKLGMTKLETEDEIDSLVDDPIFKTFQIALAQEFSDLSDIWQDTLVSQIYQDPTDYLITPQNNKLAAFLHNLEPGIKMDYNKMQDDLHTYQYHIAGGYAPIRAMYDFLTNITGAHHDFIRSSIAMHSYHLFFKMVDRFYGCVTDTPFEEFIFQTAECPIDIYYWPAYETVQATLQESFTEAQLLMQKSAQNLICLKSSTQLTCFNSTIEKAKEAKQSADAESILGKYIGSQTRAHRAARKANVTRRNNQITSSRITKNSDIQRKNQTNIHQLGCIARIPLSTPVVRALTSIQLQFSDKILADQDAQSDNEEEKKVLAGTKGLSVAAVLDKDDLAMMEEGMKLREPVGGLLPVKGYELMNVVVVPG